MYDCYVKTSSCKSCRRKFHTKFSKTKCPSPSGDTVSELTNKVQTHGILIDRSH
jgi:hypothetical protein